MTKWIVLGVLALIPVIGFLSYVSYYNSAVGMESSIVAQYNDNKQELATYGLKVIESARVSDKYKDSVKEVAIAAIEGRYGEDGAKQAILLITEQNPSIDSSVYLNLQQTIQAGRDAYKNKQTLLMDKCRAYTNLQKSFVSGFYLRLAGFPRTNDPTFETMCKPITSARAEKAYEAGQDEPLNF